MTIPDNLRNLVGTDTPLNLVMRVTDVTEEGEGIAIHIRVGIDGDPASFDVEEYPISEVRITREAAEAGSAGIVLSVADAMAADLLMCPHDLRVAEEANRGAG